jgi:hypothetical protein
MLQISKVQNQIPPKTIDRFILKELTDGIPRTAEMLSVMGSAYLLDFK